MEGCRIVFPLTPNIHAQGINMQYERARNSVDAGLVLIGAAALGALVAAILSKK